MAAVCIIVIYVSRNALAECELSDVDPAHREGQRVDVRSPLPHSVSIRPSVGRQMARFIADIFIMPLSRTSLFVR